MLINNILCTEQNNFINKKLAVFHIICYNRSNNGGVGDLTRTSFNAV